MNNLRFTVFQHNEPQNRKHAKHICYRMKRKGMKFETVEASADSWNTVLPQSLLGSYNSQSNGLPFPNSEEKLHSSYAEGNTEEKHESEKDCTETEKYVLAEDLNLRTVDPPSIPIREYPFEPGDNQIHLTYNSSSMCSDHNNRHQSTGASAEKEIDVPSFFHSHSSETQIKEYEEMIDVESIDEREETITQSELLKRSLAVEAENGGIKGEEVSLNEISCELENKTLISRYSEQTGSQMSVQPVADSFCYVPPSSETTTISNVNLLDVLKTFSWDQIKGLANYTKAYQEMIQQPTQFYNQKSPKQAKNISEFQIENRLEVFPTNSNNLLLSVRSEKPIQKRVRRKDQVTPTKVSKAKRIFKETKPPEKPKERGVRLPRTISPRSFSYLDASKRHEFPNVGHPCALETGDEHEVQRIQPAKQTAQRQQQFSGMQESFPMIYTGSFPIRNLGSTLLFMPHQSQVPEKQVTEPSSPIKQNIHNMYSLETMIGKNIEIDTSEAAQRNSVDNRLVREINTHNFIPIQNAAHLRNLLLSQFPISSDSQSASSTSSETSVETRVQSQKLMRTSPFERISVRSTALPKVGEIGTMNVDESSSSSTTFPIRPMIVPHKSIIPNAFRDPLIEKRAVRKTRSLEPTPSSLHPFLRPDLSKFPDSQQLNKQLSVSTGDEYCQKESHDLVKQKASHSRKRKSQNDTENEKVNTCRRKENDSMERESKELNNSYHEQATSQMFSNEQNKNLPWMNLQNIVINGLQYTNHHLNIEKSVYTDFLMNQVPFNHVGSQNFIQIPDDRFGMMQNHNLDLPGVDYSRQLNRNFEGNGKSKRRLKRISTIQHPQFIEVITLEDSDDDVRGVEKVLADKAKEMKIEKEEVDDDHF
uniref:Methylcytosine dioxygenase n=1 Tax=Caenorhabditis tropicalis TaxID=1561998 RepID=A0A1I7UCC2_9PELO